MCKYTYIYVYIYIHTFINMYIYAYEYIYAHTLIYKNMYVCMNLCVRTCRYIHTRMSIHRKCTWGKKRDKIPNFGGKLQDKREG